MLEAMRIGSLSPGEEPAAGDIEDPYGHEPVRPTWFNVVNPRPFNAESDPILLVDSFITPSALFYIRNHMPIPKAPGQDYKLTVGVEGSNPSATFTLE
jgi:sulfite oxidase